MRTDFIGLPLDVVSLEDVVRSASEAIERKACLTHCSLNALKVVQARKDASLRFLLDRFDLVTADGMSIVWGMGLLGSRLAGRVAGVELMDQLLREGARRGWSFFFLGGRPEVADCLVPRVKSLFPGARISGVRHGYFAAHQEKDVVQTIAGTHPDVLFVGMPSPRKERFLIENRAELNVPFSMGVGGGLDLLAGRTRRAPVWMRSSGLEWSYRVLQEPRRLAGRYLLTNIRFAALLASAVFRPARVEGKSRGSRRGA
jgi:N-acetylglucosaminyldiphosphoundecaprenol N-acetyl-beta-D-mannosaminyltransferase